MGSQKHLAMALLMCAQNMRFYAEMRKIIPEQLQTLLLTRSLQLSSLLHMAGAKGVFKHVQNAQIQINPTHAQSCSPLIQSEVANDSVSRH